MVAWLTISRWDIKYILGVLLVGSHVLYFAHKCFWCITVWLLRTVVLVHKYDIQWPKDVLLFPHATTPSNVVALWEVFPLTLFSMCVLKRGLPTRECWLTSSTACWVKRPELQEAQEVEQLEPAYRVLPRKQVQPPFPLLLFKSLCCLDLFFPAQIFFFNLIWPWSWISLALLNSDPCQKMVCAMLNAQGGRVRGSFCCRYSHVSVQPEKEFLNARERKIVLLLTEQLTPEETCTRPVCNIPPVINAPVELMSLSLCQTQPLLICPRVHFTSTAPGHFAWWRLPSSATALELRSDCQPESDF